MRELHQYSKTGELSLSSSGHKECYISSEITRDYYDDTGKVTTKVKSLSYSCWLRVCGYSYQQHLKLVLIPLDSLGIPLVHQSVEENSSHWINVTDVLHFMIIFGSEHSGYRHLEMVTMTTGSTKDVSDMMQHCMVQRNVLTSGEWMIKQDQIWVDEDRQLVYFWRLTFM